MLPLARWRHAHAAVEAIAPGSKHFAHKSQLQVGSFMCSTSSAHARTHARTHTHTHANTHVHTHTHTHTHTATQTPRRASTHKHTGIHTHGSYEETCSQRHGNDAFWNFYFKEDTSGNRGTFKFFTDDVSEWFSQWVNSVARSDGWQKGGIDMNSPEFQAVVQGLRRDAVPGADALPTAPASAEDAGIAGKARARPPGSGAITRSSFAA